MKLSDFDYYLPKELISQYPKEERDSSRLMVLDRKTKSIEHRVFRDIKEYLRKDDLLVLNNTKVLPCRLKGRRQSGGKVEILLLNQKDRLRFNALIRPGRLKVNEEIIFDGGSVLAKVTQKNEVSFQAQDIDTVYALGKMPLPPYIKREPQDSDAIHYQTVYAQKQGAVASPTAGLHFTKGLLEHIGSTGTAIAYITLHVGYATFKPVKDEDITRHKMEKEQFVVPAQTIKMACSVKDKGAKIFAVGTTSVRTLETIAKKITDYGLPFTDYEDFTNLFIYPGFDFKMVDCLITNFHLPKTSLFILACAFAGTEFIKKAYQEAVNKKYRFYSYGDAMLII